MGRIELAPGLVQEYLRRLALFALIVAGIGLIQHVPPFSWIVERSSQQLRWNWLEPVCLVAAIALGRCVFRPDPAPLRDRTALVAGLAIVLAAQLLARNPISSMVGRVGGDTALFLFTTGVLEELLFRWIGFGALRAVESRLYRQDFLKQLAPLSLVLTALVFALAHGVEPLMRGGGFRWTSYAFALRLGVTLGIWYVAARSVWVTGVLHFLENAQRLLPPG